MSLMTLLPPVLLMMKLPLPWANPTINAAVLVSVVRNTMLTTKLVVMTDLLLVLKPIASFCKCLKLLIIYILCIYVYQYLIKNLFIYDLKRQKINEKILKFLHSDC